MQVNNEKDIIKFLSQERLTTYYYNGRYSDLMALRRYRYNLDLSSSVYEAISILEVVLRNSIVLAWQNHYGDPNWPWSKLNIPTVKKYQFTLNDIDKAVSKIVKRKARGSVINGDVVSELTFGFWLYCFDAKFDYVNKSIITDIFPHDSERTKNLIEDVRRIKSDLIPIWKLRNRVSHHEPIFHLRDLKSRFDNIRKLISYIEPSCLQLHDPNGFNSTLSKGW